jgi:hypothetical protein
MRRQKQHLRVEQSLAQGTRGLPKSLRLA